MNILNVDFTGRQSNKLVASSLYQYDYGQVLKVNGIELPEVYEVHFANKTTGYTKTMLGGSEGVRIPDEFLISGEEIVVYIFLHAGETDGETEYRINIPVIKRPVPTDVKPTDEEQGLITQTVAALNSAVDSVRDVESAARAYAETASESASQASDYADVASGYASDAQGYSQDASGYALNAANSASDAANRAADASGFANSAAESATNAEGYKTQAGTFAQNALDSAEDAANSASDAADSAHSASGYADTADLYARAASDSSSAASASANRAANSASETEAALEAAQSVINDAEEAAAAANAAVESMAEYTDKIDELDAKVNKYDDLLAVIKITDASTTMGDVVARLNSVNSAGDHVVFDVSGLNAGMYLCTIYLGEGYYRIADLVTGFEGTGFFTSSDLLKDIISSGSTSSGKHYTVQWDQVTNLGTRLNDAATITTDTTNFGHFGSVNENYDNPFDSIYPWSGRKLCNIDLDLYRALTPSSSLEDCIIAWEDEANFSYAHQYGVWVYTPPFFGRSYIIGNYRYFDVTDENLQNNIAYKASLNGRWHGCGVTLTIDGASKTCNLPTLGISLANVTLASQHTFAKNYGGSLVSIYDLDASSLLFFVEYAGFNIQNKIGSGASSVYAQGLHVANDVNDGNILTFSAANANFVIGAIIDIGTSDGGYNVARTYITEVNGTIITLADNVTCTTGHFVSVHGIINMADEDIGSHSGYIGANGKCNAYYRGEVLYANKFQYILGAYRQTGTGAIWIAGENEADDYDSLNTNVHKNTGLVLPTSNGYVKTMGMIKEASFVPFCTEIGGSSSAPYGDYCYIPSLSTGDTVLLFGGFSNSGDACGFSGDWNYASSASSWACGSRPLWR